MNGSKHFRIEDVTFASRKWHPGFERTVRTLTGSSKPVNITEIVIHGTGGLGTYEFVKDGGRRMEYVKGIALFHYIIEYDLDIIRQIAPTSRWYFHSSSGKHDATTIGIELENPHKMNGVPYLDQQYEMLEYLIFEVLLKEYPTIQRIVSHDYNAHKYSNSSKSFCPGKFFEWNRLENMFKNHNIQFSRVEYQCIELN